MQKRIWLLLILIMALTSCEKLFSNGEYQQMQHEKNNNIITSKTGVEYKILEFNYKGRSCIFVSPTVKWRQGGLHCFKKGN